MSNPHEESSGATGHRKYAGVRQRKWGKWVSEIRVPGTQERLWLGSYSSPEGAAIAHDVAMYCLRGPSASDKLNFPLQRMPSTVGGDMSLRSVQKAASDAGMAVDASLIATRPGEGDRDGSQRHRNAVTTEGGNGHLSISAGDYL